MQHHLNNNSEAANPFYDICIFASEDFFKMMNEERSKEKRTRGSGLLILYNIKKTLLTMTSYMVNHMHNPTPTHVFPFSW